MSLSCLDHCSIRTEKLEDTRDFYVDILGMEDGKRPDFPFPGAWLYVDGKAVIHLVGIDRDDPSGLQEYLGGTTNVALLEGSGAFDHIAFRAKEPELLISRLKDKGYPYSEREVPDMKLRQLFLKDPNGITLELNYWVEDQQAAIENG